MMVLLVFSIFLLAFSSVAVAKYPWCLPEQSSKGRWLNTRSLTNSTENLSGFEKYYIGTSCKNALEFSQAWVPSSECSLHRFTKMSLQRALKIKISQSVPEPAKTTDGVKRIKWLFIGDSSLRGIFCGIIHVLEGSESDGPCINRVCGGLDEDSYRGPNPPKRKSGGKPFILGAVSYHVINKLFELGYFNTQLILHFVYVKTINTDPNLQPILMEVAKGYKKGDTIIHNSGAWDFDKYARKRKQDGVKSVPSEKCDDDSSRAISQNRTNNATISTMLEMSRIAKETGVQLIYSNNHYQERFGPLCADEGLEAALKGSQWEIFNNRDISRDVWKKQCPDGFHFARENIGSVADHRKYSAFRLALDGVYPGQLEMQLAQTLLFQILHDSLGEMF